MEVWLGTLQQRVAACTILLMAGLCILDHRSEFDMPHLHTEEPIMPATTAVLSVSGTNTVSAISYHLPIGLWDRKA